MSGVEHMESRIINLETKSAYQEHLIGELNEVIIEQQKQMDALRVSMKQLRSYIQAAGTQEQVSSEVDAPPPHY